MAATGDSLMRQVGHRWSHEIFFTVFLAVYADWLGQASGLEQILLAAPGERLKAEFIETRLSGDPSLRCAIEVALED